MQTKSILVKSGNTERFFRSFASFVRFFRFWFRLVPVPEQGLCKLGCSALLQAFRGRGGEELPQHQQFIFTAFT